MSFIIDITYASILDQTKKLSAFEGREVTGPSGDSQFESILITEQDEDLINDYRKQALGAILQKVGRMVADVTPSGITGEVWTLRDSGYDSAKYGTVLKQHIQEAACAYIMQQWLSSRLPGRVEFYSSLFANMLHLISQNIYSRTVTRPTYE